LHIGMCKAYIPCINTLVVNTYC